MTTILDAVRNHGDSADVYDAEYDDGGMGWVVEDDMKDDGDAFGRVVYRLAETIEVKADNGPYSVVAYISAYIERSLDMWTEFGREFNNDRAQISDEEEGMYWAVKTVQNLACGMYSDDAYEWLEKRMLAQEEE